MSALSHPTAVQHAERACAVCLDCEAGPTSRMSLGFDVRVWLCAKHAGEAFHVQNGGRDFVAALVRVWVASGGLRRQHYRAIEAHLEKARRMLVERGSEHRSYHWPTLRTEMETRLGAGEELEEIVADFERRHGNDVARLPSMRTFRRWRAQRRDFAPRTTGPGVRRSPGRASPSRRPAGGAMLRGSAMSPLGINPSRSEQGRGAERESRALPVSPAAESARPPPPEP